MEQLPPSENTCNRPWYKEAPLPVRVLRYRVNRATKEITRFSRSPSLESSKVLFLGNRITAAAWVIIISSAVALTITEKSEIVLATGGGTLLLCISELGLGTLKVYRKTKEKLLKGEIPSLSDVIEETADCEAMDIEPNDIGYCKMQGIYLAFKSLGMIDKFESIFPPQKLKNF